MYREKKRCNFMIDRKKKVVLLGYFMSSKRRCSTSGNINIHTISTNLFIHIFYYVSMYVCLYDNMWGSFHIGYPFVFHTTLRTPFFSFHFITTIIISNTSHLYLYNLSKKQNRKRCCSNSVYLLYILIFYTKHK